MLTTPNKTFMLDMPDRRTFPRDVKLWTRPQKLWLDKHVWLETLVLGPELAGDATTSTHLILARIGVANTPDDTGEPMLKVFREMLVPIELVELSNGTDEFWVLDRGNKRVYHQIKSATKQLTLDSATLF